VHVKGTSRLANLPLGRHAIDSKWVFKVKSRANGCVNRFKARLAGFNQRQDVDYSQTFSSVVKLGTLWTVLALMAAHGMHAYFVNIETSFLNADFLGKIFMRQPQGAGDGTARVLRLLKSIYGLKQACRVWYSLFHTTLTLIGLRRSTPDTIMYSMNHLVHGICIGFVYVDDIMMVFYSLDWGSAAITNIRREFNMIDFRDAPSILGVNITDGTVRMSQTQYTKKLLEKYGMFESNPSLVPMSPTHYRDVNTAPPSDMAPLSPIDRETFRVILGSMNFLLCISTRPGIAFAISVISRCRNAPFHIHMKQLERLFVVRFLWWT
jgi:hypothetical protein